MAEERKKPKGLLLLLRWQKNFNALPDEAAGRMIKAMFEYEINDSDIVFNDPVLDFFWNEVQEWLDDNNRRWEEIVEKRSEAGKIGAAVKNKKQMPASVNKCQQVLTNLAKGKGKGKGKGIGKGKGFKEEKEKVSDTSITSSSFVDDILCEAKQE